MGIPSLIRLNALVIHPSCLPKGLSEMSECFWVLPHCVTIGMCRRLLIIISRINVIFSGLFHHCLKGTVRLSWLHNGRFLATGIPYPTLDIVLIYFLLLEARGLCSVLQADRLPFKITLDTVSSLFSCHSRCATLKNLSIKYFYLFSHATHTAHNP